MTLLAGCATTGILREARRAEERLDYDRAVIEYTRALQLDPNSVTARTGLQRAKVRSSQDHFTRARRLAALGRLDDAVAEYQLAAELNPLSGEIAEELQSHAEPAPRESRGQPQWQHRARGARRADARSSRCQGWKCRLSRSRNRSRSRGQTTRSSGRWLSSRK